MAQKLALAAVALGATLAMGAASEPANAAVILSFAQVSGSPTIIATNPTSSTTSIKGTNVAVTISGPASGSSSPIGAFLTVNLTSVGAATTAGGFITEPFSGTATFTSGIGSTGTNYLSATFLDTVFGVSGASSLVLQASTPANSVTFTSSILPASALGDPRALAFSFADVTPPSSLVGTAPNLTLAAFVSSVSGTVSANPVPAIPEPASFAMLGAGLVAAGLLTRKGGKSRSATA